MSNIKISQLPAASTIDANNDVLPVVNSNVTKKVTPNLLVKSVLASPGPIGSTSASTATFTGLAVSGSVDLNGYITSNDTAAWLHNPRFWDYTKTHSYRLNPSEISADRYIILPALTANDTFVFAEHPQVIANKVISGSTNTLSNIANSSLTNSAITINGTSVSLGGSITLSGSTQWTTSGSNIYYNTGNVGFNNASPTQRVDVSGTVKATGSFTPVSSSWTSSAFRAQGSFGGGLSLIDGAAGWGVWTESSGDNINFGQGTTSGGLTKRWTINSNGALAIGGNYGTTGQVLTSGGGGAMSWSSAPSGGIYYNVKDYGAVGNGTTDDTEAFNAAITAAGSGTVYVPAGTYRITNTLSLDDCTLLGEGRASTISAVIADAASPILYLARQASVRNLQILYASGVTGSETQGQKVAIKCGNVNIRYGALQRTVIDYVTIGLCGTAFYESGLFISNDYVECVFSTTFSNIWANDFTYRGFDFRSTVRTGNVYQNVYLGGNDARTCNCLFALQGQETESSIVQLNIEHCTFSQNAVLLDGCTGFSVTSMHFEAVIPSGAGKHFMACTHSSGSFNSISLINCVYTATSVSLVQLNSSYNNYWSANGGSGDPLTANYYEFAVLNVENMSYPSGSAVFSRGINDGPMFVNVGSYDCGPSGSSWQSFPTSGNITFVNNGYNSSSQFSTIPGKLIIGNSYVPTYKLTCENSSAGIAAVVNYSGSTGGGATINTWNGFTSTYPVYGFWYDSNTGLGNPSFGVSTIICNTSEAARFTSSAITLSKPVTFSQSVSGTSATFNGTTTLRNDSLTTPDTGATTNVYRPTQGSVAQYYVGSTVSGQLYISSGGTPAFYSGSDYRLKTNIADIQNAIDVVKQLKPCSFNVGDNPDTQYGFVAHELQQAWADAVMGEKDAVDADGNPVYQQVAYTKLVPVLTKCLVELIAKVEALEQANV